jgi:oligopeptide/dipeptide ABC transporter ATP-binding protein
MALLEVTDLKTRFITERGTVRSVDGVSFTLEEGRTLGIVGESGCGKSVLSRSVMGLLPRRNVHREGSVVFKGEDVTRKPQKELRKMWGPGMAMIFQDPMTSLNPVVKVGRQLTESLMLHLDVKRDFATDTAEELLRSVGIPEPKRRLSQYPFELSGGMRQRVVIAIALACGPELLFADEPTTALDVTVQKQILNLLQTLQRDRRMAMILVTHDLGVVAGRTDDIMVMYAGQAVELAPTKKLFTNMRHPYTQALMKSIPKIAEPSHTRLEAIGGRPPNLITPPTGCRFAPRCALATEQCHAELPPLAADPAEPDHLFRCWHPVGISTRGADRTLTPAGGN